MAFSAVNAMHNLLYREALGLQAQDLGRSLLTPRPHIARAVTSIKLIKEEFVRRQLADIAEAYAYTDPAHVERNAAAQAEQAKAIREAHKRVFISRLPNYNIDIAAGDRALLALGAKLEAQQRKASASTKKPAHSSPKLSMHEEPPVYISSLPNFDVAAGKPINLNDADGLIDIRSDSPLSSEQYFTVTARGSSMTALGIPDGGRCLCRRQAAVDNGAIAVVNIDGEATLKKFVKEKNRIVLHWCDGSGQTMVISAGDGKTVDVIGAFVRVIE